SVDSEIVIPSAEGDDGLARGTVETVLGGAGCAGHDGLPRNPVDYRILGGRKPSWQCRKSGILRGLRQSLTVRVHMRVQHAVRSGRVTLTRQRNRRNRLSVWSIRRWPARWQVHRKRLDARTQYRD